MASVLVDLGGGEYKVIGRLIVEHTAKVAEFRSSNPLAFVVVADMNSAGGPMDPAFGSQGNAARIRSGGVWFKLPENNNPGALTNDGSGNLSWQ
jgi:hypothetical protein